MLLAHERLRDAGEALIAAANEAGGRDNITVVLLRLEEVQHGAPALMEEGATMVSAPSVSVPQQPADGASGADAALGAVALESASAPPSTRRTPRAATPAASRPRRRRLRHAGALAFTLVVLGLLGAGAYLALQSVYFIGTNNRGLVTMFEGLPYRLPGNLNLYTSSYVSGVSASTLSPEKRHTLLDHSLRSEGNAAALVRSLELEQLE